MSLDPNSAEFITLKEAKDYVNTYRRLYPNAIKGYFAGANKLNDILGQDGCVGIRFYNGYSEDEKRTNLVAVGVDDQGHDMVEGYIMERMMPCPTHCDPNGGLGG